ncbi:hypothetical protein VNO77_21898 [Canavalia gladiata]|uniref:Uncharacterized protein n=1 Tax=Canavalia gladiata TaxID=3824 RepID=A0AAN9L1S6_CANGL
MLIGLYAHTALCPTLLELDLVVIAVLVLNPKSKHHHDMLRDLPFPFMEVFVPIKKVTLQSSKSSEVKISSQDKEKKKLAGQLCKTREKLMR